MLLGGGTPGKTARGAENAGVVERDGVSRVGRESLLQQRQGGAGVAAVHFAGGESGDEPGDAVRLAEGGLVVVHGAVEVAAAAARLGARDERRPVVRVARELDRAVERLLGGAVVVGAEVGGAEVVEDGGFLRVRLRGGAQQDGRPLVVAGAERLLAFGGGVGRNAGAARRGEGGGEREEEGGAKVHGKSSPDGRGAGRAPRGVDSRRLSYHARGEKSTAYAREENIRRSSSSPPPSA